MCLTLYRFLLALGMLAAGLVFVLGVHPFLAVSERVDEPDLLVVEGWMADYNLPIGRKRTCGRSRPK
ncbi:MAG: hypothetical protein KDN22_08500 [Verrucomicrobiae bacterium]|nr:hypothetical protein [Verrucomicrobiae bacterium]